MKGIVNIPIKVSFWEMTRPGILGIHLPAKQIMDAVEKLELTPDITEIEVHLQFEYGLKYMTYPVILEMKP